VSRSAQFVRDGADRRENVQSTFDWCSVGVVPELFPKYSGVFQCSRTCGARSTRAAVAIAKQIADALKAAHAQGIVVLPPAEQ
jgi:hypothetical protein